MIHQVGRSNDFHHLGGKFASIIHGRWNEPAVKPSLLQAGWLAKPSMASAELAKVTYRWIFSRWLVGAKHLARSGSSKENMGFLHPRSLTVRPCKNDGVNYGVKLPGGKGCIISPTCRDAKPRCFPNILGFPGKTTVPTNRKIPRWAK